MIYKDTFARPNNILLVIVCWLALNAKTDDKPKSNDDLQMKMYIKPSW